MNAKRIITRAILATAAAGSIATGVAVPIVAATAPAVPVAASHAPDVIGYGW